jgi:hypothetical protein
VVADGYGGGPVNVSYPYPTGIVIRGKGFFAAWWSVDTSLPGITVSGSAPTLTTDSAGNNPLPGYGGSPIKTGTTNLLGYTFWNVATDGTQFWLQFPYTLSGNPKTYSYGPFTCDGSN